MLKSVPGNDQPVAMCIQYCDVTTLDHPCGVCGAPCDLAVGPEIFTAGTVQIVCHPCALKNAPALVAMREALGGWTFATKNSPVTTDEYFGGCPHCGKSACINVWKNHFGTCEEHQVYWPIGYNLLSNWQEEDPAVWEKNEKLLAEFTEVEPIRPAPESPDEFYAGCESLAVELSRFLRGVGGAYAEPLATVLYNQASALVRSLEAAGAVKGEEMEIPF